VSCEIEQTADRLAVWKGCVTHVGTCFINRFLGHARGCTRLAIFHAKTLKYIQQVLAMAQYECAIVAVVKQHAQALLHGASVRAYKESLYNVLEHSHLLKVRTAD
jgi:hypothetical protein